MKKHIRLISFVLLLLSFSAFCACTPGTVTKSTDVCIKINNEPLDNSYIGYFFYIAKTSMISEAGYTGGNSSEEDIRTYWETAEIDGVNAVEVARDVAADNAVFQKIQYQKAIEEGITLSEEQLASMKAEIADIVSKEFDLRPYSIIKTLNLKSPIYKNTAAYGHFGRSEFPWEKLDRVDDLKKYL